MSLYTNTEAYVRTSSGEPVSSEPHPACCKVTLWRRTCLSSSSTMFSAFHCAKMLMGTRFADGCLLVKWPLSYLDLPLPIPSVRTCPNAQVGLRINPQKTEVMCIGIVPTTPIRTLSGDLLPTCTEVRYLWCNVSNSRSALQCRRNLAWVACRKLDVVWTWSASDHLKIKLFTACIESVLFYSGANWTPTETLEKTIDASHPALLCYALNVRYTERTTNAELYRRSNAPPASTTLCKQRLQLIGHATRRDIPLSLLLDKNNQPTEPYRRGGAL